MVPLIMALRQDTVRLLIADDVGVGKTVEALLIVRELLERRKIKRFAVVCLPHLCDQWQEEIRAKLDIEAVIIRSNTQARLDRQIQGDTSVYDYYPYQVISIDFIKSDARRDVFIEQCPELVIVDEAHTCARPPGPRQGPAAALPPRQPTSPRSPTSTWSCSRPRRTAASRRSSSRCWACSSPSSRRSTCPTPARRERRELARHFVQRKRADVEKWMGEDTPFPKRDAFEWPYDLSRELRRRSSTRSSTSPASWSCPDESGGKARSVSTTGPRWRLLRGVMSSPAPASKMLNTRLDKLAAAATMATQRQRRRTSPRRTIRSRDHRVRLRERQRADPGRRAAATGPTTSVGSCGTSPSA